MLYPYGNRHYFPILSQKNHYICPTENNTGNTMAKIKYYGKENTKVGRHSYYAVPMPNGLLEFDEVCEEACRNTSIEPAIMRAAVMQYMKAVQVNVLKGFRVQLGEHFLIVYPNLNASVKDEVDEHGNVIQPATLDMLSARKGKSRLGCSVAVKFSQEFAQKVTWQKVDERTGAELPDSEDITQDVAEDDFANP